MEALISAITGLGLTRDVAVNIAFEAVRWTISSGIFATVFHWFQRRREKARSDTIIARAYTEADNAILSFIRAGAFMARLPDDPRPRR